MHSRRPPDGIRDRSSSIRDCRTCLWSWVFPALPRGPASAGSMPTAACKRRRSVDRQKCRLCKRFGHVAPCVEARVNLPRCGLLQSDEGILCRDGFAIVLNLISQCLDPESHQGICIREKFVLKPKRVELPQLIGRRRHGGTYDRLGKRPIKARFDLGYFGHRGELALVCSIVSTERPDIIECPRFAAHDPYGGRSFFLTCGGRVTSVRDEEAEVMIGSLDEAPTDLRPEYELWIRRRENWVLPLPWASQFDGDRDTSQASPCHNQVGSLVLNPTPSLFLCPAQSPPV